MTSNSIFPISDDASNWAMIRNAGEDLVTVFKLHPIDDAKADPFQFDRAFVIGNYKGSERTIFEIVDSRQIEVRSNTRDETQDAGFDDAELHWKSNFEFLVQDALDSIRSDQFEKVVPSASWDIPSTKDPFVVFQNLLEMNPDVTVFMIHTEGSRTWLGASPEILFEKTGNALYSMALAGTRSAGEKEWGDKEQKEQAIVTEHIESVLQNLGFRDIERSDTKTVDAGAIEHICTEIRAKSANDSVWSDLLRELHPTAALMGYPRNKAIQFIREHEIHDRELFTGYFGVVDKQDARFTIMIRCAKYLGDAYRLFAGAGVNAASEPAKESAEILQKFNVVRSAINR